LSDDWKIQISYSGNGPMVNVRGDSPAEVAALLQGITADDVAKTIGGAGESMRAILALGPLLAPQAAQNPQNTAAPGESLEHYFRADELVCATHGSRVLKKGIAKTGRPYVNATCAGHRDCPTIWSTKI
jgi:hypothetical protein